MKTVALVIAAGVGSRTGNYIPKQFISVFDKPLVIWTLEKFEQSSIIDEINVVCLAGWEETVRTNAMQYGISKLKSIFLGGGSAQESIYNGLKGMDRATREDDIVVIHDGIRPMADESIIRSCVDTCMKLGNGVSTLPVYEQIFCAYSDSSAKKYIPRDNLRVLQTPQAYRYGEIFSAYRQGRMEEKGFEGSAYANTLMADLGKTLYFSEGSTKNIKITTNDDIAVFKAMVSEEQRE